MISTETLRGKRNGYRFGAGMFAVIAVIAAVRGSVFYAAGGAVATVVTVSLAVFYQRLYIKQLLKRGASSEPDRGNASAQLDAPPSR